MLSPPIDDDRGGIITLRDSERLGEGLSLTLGVTTVYHRRAIIVRCSRPIYSTMLIFRNAVSVTVYPPRPPLTKQEDVLSTLSRLVCMEKCGQEILHAPLKNAGQLTS